MDRRIWMLVGGLLILGAIGVVSAHGYGYGYMPMMGYGYGMGYEADERVEVSGEVVDVFGMGVVLDNGRYVIAPWWFLAEIGVKTGDSIKAVGFGDRGVMPVYIEVNGEGFGDPDGKWPVWMEEERESGYGYYHCPMMGW
jgi:hypothetical protein